MVKQIRMAGVLPVCLFLLSCGGQKSGDQQAEDISGVSGYPVTIAFEKGIETEQEVLLSEIAKEVKIVPLETKPGMSGSQSEIRE